MYVIMRTVSNYVAFTSDSIKRYSASTTNPEDSEINVVAEE
jgi:hypothetical protein